MILICNDRPAAQASVRALREYSDPLSLVRLARLHGGAREARETLLASDAWQAATVRLAHVVDPPELKLDA